MSGVGVNYSDFLDRRNLIDRQILRLAKNGILNVGVILLDDKVESFPQ